MTARASGARLEHSDADATRLSRGVAVVAYAGVSHPPGARAHDLESGARWREHC